MKSGPEVERSKRVAVVERGTRGCSGRKDCRDERGNR